LTLADLTGDAAAGEAAYAKCRVCHLIEPDKNAMGPTLYGVVGRKAGAVEGFAYSDANASADITWTSDVLFDYLEAPRDYLPGSRMAFPGIRDAQERADLIAYLETQG
jgi:cytochrome c